MSILQFEKGKPSEDIVKLLTENVIGTPGQSLVYQHLKTKEKLDHIHDPAFLSLRLAGKVVGTACLIFRKVLVGGELRKACYIRYFSFRNAFRSKSDPIRRLNRSSAVRQEVNALFEKLLETNDLIYAYVDPGNIRSLRIIEDFQFQEVGRFNTIFFSRFWPESHPNVEQVSQSNDMNSFKKQLEATYQDHHFFFDDYVGYQEGAFVYRKEGRIVAGIQAHAEHWKIHEIPGNRHLVRFVSRVPLINRIFNQDFQFLSLEGLFCEAGCESVLPVLISHALKEKQRYTAIACIDPNSNLYRLIQKMDGGFIRHLTSEKQMAVVARGNKEILDQMKQQPVYVSGFDNM